MLGLAAEGGVEKIRPVGAAVGAITHALMADHPPDGEARPLVQRPEPHANLRVRSTWMLPYGGFKLSGLGRENGMEAIGRYTETKTVVIALSEEMPADPFAD